MYTYTSHLDNALLYVNFPTHTCLCLTVRTTQDNSTYYLTSY